VDEVAEDAHLNAAPGGFGVDSVDLMEGEQVCTIRYNWIMAATTT
jgi:hypothetical protein